MNFPTRYCCISAVSMLSFRALLHKKISRKAPNTLTALTVNDRVKKRTQQNGGWPAAKSNWPGYSVVQFVKWRSCSDDMKNYWTHASYVLDTKGLSSTDIINFVSCLDNARIKGFRKGFFPWDKSTLDTGGLFSLNLENFVCRWRCKCRCGSFYDNKDHVFLHYTVSV